MVFDPNTVTFRMTPGAEEFQKPTSTTSTCNRKLGCAFPIGLKANFACTCTCNLYNGICWSAGLKGCIIKPCGTGYGLSQNINMLDLTCFSCTTVFSAEADRPPLYCLDCQHIDITFHQQARSPDPEEWRLYTPPMEAKSLLKLWVWTLRVWLHEICSCSLVCLQISHKWISNITS